MDKDVPAVSLCLGTGQTANEVPADTEGSTLKERIHEFGADTTFHGVRFITDYKLHCFRRLVWLCLVGGMSGYLLYGVITSIMLYNERPVTSVVKINYAQQLRFPAVTFCNYNQWRKSVVPPDFYEAIRSLDPFTSGPVNTSYLETHNVTSLSQRLVNATHQIEDMLQKCSFKAQQCSSDNFTQVLTDFGVCYTFNGDPDRPLHMHQSGSHNALFLEIDIQQHEYIYGMDNSAGIKLLLHPQGERPLVKELGIAVQPGYETLLGIQMEQVVNLKAPFESNCSDGPLNHSSIYTVPLCQFEHKVKILNSRCGCRDMRFPGDEEECPLSNYYGCLIPTEAALTAEDSSYECRVPCNLTIYEPHISMALYPAQSELDSIQKECNRSESDIRKNIVRLRIYFKQISYLKMEEIPSYSFSNLQSSIGGYMGLLIGASLITVFEFADFLLSTAAAYLRKSCAPEKGRRIETGEKTTRTLKR